MRYAYPCIIEFDEGGPMEVGGEVLHFTEGYTVSFPDVPEALTCGDTWEEAIEMAEDCIGVAMTFYVRDNLDLPKPSPVRDGQVLISVPLLVAAKLTVYTAMREQGITNEDLASRLDMSADAIQKLLDPRYRTHVSHLERALRAVGRGLVVEDCDAYPSVKQEAALAAQTTT